MTADAQVTVAKAKMTAVMRAAYNIAASSTPMVEAKEVDSRTFRMFPIMMQVLIPHYSAIMTFFLLLFLL